MTVHILTLLHLVLARSARFHAHKHVHQFAGLVRYPSLSIGHVVFLKLRVGDDLLEFAVLEVASADSLGELVGGRAQVPPTKLLLQPATLWLLLHPAPVAHENPISVLSLPWLRPILVVWTKHGWHFKLFEASGEKTMNELISHLERVQSVIGAEWVGAENFAVFDNA